MAKSCNALVPLAPPSVSFPSINYILIAIVVLFVFKIFFCLEHVFFTLYSLKESCDAVDDEEDKITERIPSREMFRFVFF